MGKPSRPKKGSMGFGPRKRVKRISPRFSSWPELAEGPKIMGFAGYKAGMTHIIMTDYRQKSTTANQEIQVPVTVLEVPPMKVVGIRYYTNSPYGLKVLGEDWKNVKDKNLMRRIPKHSETVMDQEKTDAIDEVRLIAYSQPHLVKGIPKKVPELMELPIGGNDLDANIKFAKEQMGKTITFKDFSDEGNWIDVAAFTKGKGFQGHVKRWGVKLLSHKNSKHRRMIGNLGPKSQGGGKDSGYVLPTIRQAGQMGYHQRTEYNKLVLKVGDDGEEIIPKGGFLHYGEVKNPYVLIKGSVPGPTKRLIRMRLPIRAQEGPVGDLDIKHISRESKQGA